MTHLAQAILNSIQRSLARYGRMSRLQTLALKVKFGVRKAILLVSDPPVHFRIGRNSILLPFSHNLTIDYAATPDRADNLVRIAERTNRAKGSIHFIDIGANVGDTVAILRTRLDFPILAVEGDDEFYTYLERNAVQFSDVQTSRSLLGDVHGKVQGHLTTNYGGSKQIAIQTGAEQVLQLCTFPELLDRFPEFRKAGMVKIDTDGYDCKILRGAMDWLSEARPVVFFEYDPHHLAEQGDDGISIFDRLKNIGYEGMLVFEGNGEFMFSLRLQQKEALEELHCYFLGRESKKYADLCVFHAVDAGLFEECRSAELEDARRMRSGHQADT